MVQQVGYKLNAFCDTIYARLEAILHAGPFFAGVEEDIIHNVSPNFIPDVGFENFPQHWLEGNGPDI